MLDLFCNSHFARCYQTCISHPNEYQMILQPFTSVALEAVAAVVVVAAAVATHKLPSAAKTHREIQSAAITLFLCKTALQ